MQKEEKTGTNLIEKHFVGISWTDLMGTCRNAIVAKNEIPNKIDR